MEEIKIIKNVINIPKPPHEPQYFVVLNRMPIFKYERQGDFLLAEDGGFYDCYRYERPSKYFQAFGGKEFKIPMKDGSFGRVKSLAKQVWNGNGYRSVPDKIMKPRKNKNRGEYFIVNLSKDGSKRTFRLHRLVAEAFLPNPENKRTVNHINNDPEDNRVDNLEWATDTEQHIHKMSSRNIKRGPRKVSKNKWDSVISYKNETIFLGYFNTKKQAYEAYRDKFVELHGKEPWFE